MTTPDVMGKMKGAGAGDTQIQYPNLSILDSGVCHVLDLRMLQVVTTKLKKQDQLYQNVQEDLNNYLYLVPNNKYIYFPTTFSTPKKYESEFCFQGMICKDDGLLYSEIFRFGMKNVNGDWKMQISEMKEHLLSGNVYKLYNNIKIRLKREGSDKWEMLFLHETPNGKGVCEGGVCSGHGLFSGIGTTIQDGDQIDMRFVGEDGSDVRVGQDIELRSWFPITVRIISPTESITPPEEMMVQQEKYDVLNQFIRLASCNKAYLMAMRKIMKVEMVKKLELRVQKYMRLKNELHGAVYVKPKLLGCETTYADIDIVNNVAGPFYCELVLTLPSVRLIQPDGSHIHRVVTFLWVKRRNRWLLKWNSTLGDPNMHITIKRKGCDMWGEVDLFRGENYYWSANPYDQRSVYVLKGTEFNNGDQLNVRYVHGGKSHAVSFDGSSNQNLFPVTFNIILPQWH